MKMQYYVDENVLASIMKEPGDVWQTAYAHYRAPFVAYLETQHGLEAQKGQGVFQEVFALLIHGIKEGSVCTSLGNTFFAYLLRFGEERLRSMGYSIAFTAAPWRTYLAGEVLVSLIGRGHEAAWPAIVNHYVEPIGSILKNQNGNFPADLSKEVLSESLMAMKVNIDAGAVKIPLRARFFTYLYRISSQKILDSVHQMEQVVPLGSEEELERKFEQNLEKELERGCPEFISELWTSLSPLL